MRFDAVGLFVTDMTKMVSFYRDVIGMQTDWDGKEPNAELKADGFRLIMYGRDDFEKMTSHKFGYPKDTNGTMELAYEVENFALVDREYERVVRLGAKPILSPTTEPWGQRTSYVADPDGNLVEIGSFKEQHGSAILYGVRFHMLDENPKFSLMAPRLEEPKSIWFNIFVPDIKDTFTKEKRDT